MYINLSIWPKYCRYGVKTLYNQSINQSLIKAYLAVMFVLMGLKICVENSFNFVCSILSMNKLRQYICIFVIRKPSKGMEIFNKKKLIRNNDVCNPFPRIGNPFSRISNSFPRFTRNAIRPSIYTMQPEETSCVH